MTWTKVVGGALAAAVVLILLDKHGQLRTPSPPPLIAQAVAASDSPGFQPTEETPETLPSGKGRDETFYLCTACHGTALVKAQGMRRDQWDETLSWMEEKHKMPPPDAETRGLVLDYLAANFPPRAPQQRGWVNPFANR